MLTVFELGALRQGDCYEFEVGLGYRVSSGLAWGNSGKSLSQQTRTTTKTNNKKTKKGKKGRKEDRQTEGRKDRQAWQDKE